MAALAYPLQTKSRAFLGPGLENMITLAWVLQKGTTSPLGALVCPWPRHSYIQNCMLHFNHRCYHGTYQPEKQVVPGERIELPQ